MSAIVLIQAGLDAGGVEKVLARLAAHLVGLGHTVTILAIKGRPEDTYYPVPDRVTLRTMESEMGATATGRTVARIAWIRRCVRTGHADLVVSCLTKINVQTAVATAGLKTRRIASERNNFQLQKMHPLWRALMPFTLASADHAVMLTHAQRDALPAIARHNSSVIYNAVETRDPTQAIGPGPHLVAVGRLTEQKGFDVLLRAMRLGRDAGHDLRLTIYGEGEDRAALEKLCTSLDLETAVLFGGRTHSPQGWTANPGIFVLSSRYEGFGNVIIEAMAAGFAVVATACNWGPPEILTNGEDGLLVPPEDPQALCEAILSLHGNPALRSKLAQAALRRAQDFSEHRIMGQWVDIIESVLAKGVTVPRP